MTLNVCLTGPNAVEFIINHAEVSIAFVQDNKIPSVSSIIFLGVQPFIVSLEGFLFKQDEPCESFSFPLLFWMLASLLDTFNWPSTSFLILCRMRKSSAAFKMTCINLFSDISVSNLL